MGFGQYFSWQIDPRQEGGAPQAMGKEAAVLRTLPDTEAPVRGAGIHRSPGTPFIITS